MANEVKEPDITIASTTETQDELDHAVSANWRQPFDPEKAKKEREERDAKAAADTKKAADDKKAAEADKAKKEAGSAPAPKDDKKEGDGESEDNKLPRGVQKRIDKLTARAKQAEESNAELTRRLDALEKGQKPGEKKGEEPEPEAVTQNADPEPQRKDFKDGDEYYRAHSKWSAREALRDRDREEAVNRQNEHVRQTFESHIARVEKFRDKHDDYDEVVNANTTKFSEGVVIAITEADNGPEIIYHFAKNPKVLEDLVKLSPARQVMEVGKLSASLSPSMGKKDESSPPNGKERTPAPPTPESSSRSASPLKNLSEMSTDEYIREMNRREVEARKRS